MQEILSGIPESYIRDFQSRLLERGYPRELVDKTLAKVAFLSRNEALKGKTNTSKNILPFVTTFNPAVPKLKEILMKNWFLISNVLKVARVFPNALNLLSPTGRTNHSRTF